MAKTHAEMVTRATSWLLGRKWKLEKHTAVAERQYEELIVKLAEENDPLPRDLLEAALDAILTAETGVDQTALQIIEGADYAGVWRLKRAGWERDQLGNPAEDNRIYMFKKYVRVTVLNPGANLIEDNCSEVVYETPFYDLAELPDVTPGTSGIMYRIIRQRQDEETMLWSGAIESRMQKTTTTGVVKVQDDTLRTVWEQTFYGVRTDDKDHTGAAVALWTVGAADGTRYETVSVRKNENCTRDIAQRKIVEKAVTLATATDKDIFRTVTDTEAVAATALGVRAAAGAGLSGENRDELTEGGMYRTKKRDEQENAVAAAVQSLRDDDEATVTETENTGQSAAAALPVTATAGTLVEVENRKTKGGWFVTRVRTAVAKLWENRRKIVTKDKYETVTEYQSEAVALANLPVDPPAADAGVWYRRMWIKRKDGKYDVEEAKHEEATLANAVKEQHRTAFENLTRIEEVGTTPHDWPIAAAAGKVTRTRQEITRGNQLRKTLEEREEIAVSSADVSVRKTLWGTLTRTLHKSQSASAAAPAEGNAARSTITDGLLYNQEIETWTPATGTGGAGIEAETGTLWEAVRKVLRTRTRNRTSKLAEPTTETAGQVVEITNKRTDDGNYDAEQVLDVAIKRKTAKTVKDVDGSYEVMTLENHTSAEIDTELTALTATYNNEASIQPSRYPGMLNATIRIKNPAAAGAVELVCQYTKENKKEKDKRMVSRNGKILVETYEITYTAKHAVGVAAARDDYAALNPIVSWGSVFIDQGRNWFYYKAVTSVKLTGVVDITSTYAAGNVTL
jgi:hypothetical protein